MCVFGQVNLQNRSLVEVLDQQLGEQQQQAALKPTQKKPPPPAETVDRPAPSPDSEPSVDECVAELSHSLQQA